MERDRSCDFMSLKDVYVDPFDVSKGFTTDYVAYEQQTNPAFAQSMGFEIGSGDTPNNNTLKTDFDLWLERENRNYALMKEEEKAAQQAEEEEDAFLTELAHDESHMQGIRDMRSAWTRAFEEEKKSQEESAAKKAKVAERPQPPTTIAESWRSRTSMSTRAAKSRRKVRSFDHRPKPKDNNLQYIPGVGFREVIDVLDFDSDAEWRASSSRATGPRTGDQDL